MTRQKSKELTHVRLIKAAGTLSIRKGFDDTPGEEIGEVAGYSRAIEIARGAR